MIPRPLGRGGIAIVAKRQPHHIKFAIYKIEPTLVSMKERAYKYRIYPTSEQVTLLAQTFGCVRVVYNSILRWRTDAYYNEKTKINYNAASSYLTEFKRSPELSWLNDVSCVPLQQSLRHQQTAFKHFF
ncbi:MAG: putative transposase [Paraglaciecola sp.]